MSKFKVGDRVRRDRGSLANMEAGDVATVRGFAPFGCITLKGYRGQHNPEFFSLVRSGPLTKAEKAAARKAKAERAKVMRGLSPAGKRVVDFLRGNKGAFGCQREVAIGLAAAIICDSPDKIRKALA